MNEDLLSGQRSLPRDPDDKSVANELKEVDESRIQAITESIYEVSRKSVLR